MRRSSGSASSKALMASSRGTRSNKLMSGVRPALRTARPRSCEVSVPFVESFAGKIGCGGPTSRNAAQAGAEAPGDPGSQNRAVGLDPGAGLTRAALPHDVEQEAFRRRRDGLTRRRHQTDEREQLFLEGQALFPSALQAANAKRSEALAANVLGGVNELLYDRFVCVANLGAEEVAVHQHVGCQVEQGTGLVGYGPEGSDHRWNTSFM